ncbi:EMYY motif lipoprotein [Staphylococcus agnetis]|nr:EMYY motif lipoprotein [Staphylococcus agnetis]PTH70655.1 EMYY motif lipoprotein [Staphylococcus agnetis]PTH77963.1 EMYY motif lipoprotein [Staphylococcus agnetis]
MIGEKSIRRDAMKHIFLCLLVILMLLALVGCGHHNAQEKATFDHKMKIVEQKEKAYYNELEAAHLEQLKSINRNDAIEDNKALFEKKNETMQHTLEPKFNVYKKAANQLPANNHELDTLKKTYMEAVKKKEHALKQIEAFLSLYLQTFESNENIVAHTQKFDALRSKVERNLMASKATQNGNNESEQLEETLINQNAHIKRVATNVLEEKDGRQQSESIKSEVVPVIEQNVKTLNQLRINDANVNKARQNAIQMNYALEDFYKERAQSATYSHRLSKINIKQIVKTPEELEAYEAKYNEKNDEIESKLQ